MSADLGSVQLAPTAPTIWARLFGLGSVFGKGFRDSRRAVAIVTALIALFILVGAAQIGEAFKSPLDRQLLVAQFAKLPTVLRGLLGDPINLGSLGGFVSWRIGNILPVFFGLWSVIALSGTLAGEAQAGSLEVLLATPVSRREVALEKLAVHLVGLTIAMIVGAVVTTIAAAVFKTLPGDEVPLAASLAHFLWIGLATLAGGAVAFGLAPIVGRGTAAGIGGAALFGAYLVQGYAPSVPALSPLTALSWFGWTAHHRPIAGAYDWPPVALLAAFCAAWLVIGVVAFERRDLGRTTGLRLPRIGPRGAGLGSPFSRSLWARLPGAIGWGVGIGVYAILIAASSRQLAASISSIPGIQRILDLIYPGVDYHTAGGMLQLAFFSFGILLVGLLAAVLVSGWTSDERERRLDLILAAPVGRAGWVVSSALGILAAALVALAIVAAFVALGAVADGDDPVQPVIGIGIMALYAAAIAGIGLAVGGAIRPDLATPVAAGLVIAFYLIDSLGAVLRLPDPLLQVSLTHHFGQPIAGRFDPVGVALCLLLGIGGIGLAAVGLQRRDLRG